MASDNKILKDTISETATRVTIFSGSQKHTIFDLSDDLGRNEALLNDQNTVEEDDFSPILTDMEADLLALFETLSTEPLLPETAFAQLFKNLSEILLQKPHYITLLFDEKLLTTNTKVGEALMRISDVAEGHLVSLIESGKNAGVFINGQSSKSLARSIMKSFRSMMKDEHRINVMLLESKSPETLTN